MKLTFRSSFTADPRTERRGRQSRTSHSSMRPGRTRDGVGTCWMVLPTSAAFCHPAVGHFCIVEDIRRLRTAMRGPTPIIEVGLEASDLASCRGSAFCASVRVQEVTFEMGLVIRLSNQRQPDRDVASGCDVDPGLAADQPLGAKLVVGTVVTAPTENCRYSSVKGRRAESRIGGAPDADPIRDVIQRPHVRAHHRVALVGNRRPIVGRRLAGGDRRLEIVPVVVVPAIDARAQRDDELFNRRQDVLNESAQTLLRPA